MACTSTRTVGVYLAMALAGFGHFATGAAVSSAPEAAREARQLYAVTLHAPSVLAFQAETQLPAQSRRSGLAPTAPKAGQAFDPKNREVQAYRQFLADQRHQVLAAMSSKIQRNLTTNQHWDLIGNGFSVSLTVTEAAQLSGFPGIADLHAEPVLQPLPLSTAEIRSQINAGLPGKAVSSDGEGVVIGIVGSGIDPTLAAFSATSSDGYTHQNPRGRRFGLCVDAPAAARCNNKLIGMYDFVNEAGALGIDQGRDLAGFSTAAASIIAGNPVAGTVTAAGSPIAVTHVGVAPRANLITYKMFGGPNWTGPSVGALTVVNQAVQDQVDILVLNYYTPNPTNPWTSQTEQALLQARAAGTLVVAGFDGRIEQAGEINGPGSAPWVLHSGYAVPATGHRTTLSDIHGPGLSAPISLSGQSFSPGIAEAELVFSADRANNLPHCGSLNTVPGNPSGPNNPFPLGSLTGMIVVCDYSVFSVAQMSDNAKAAGAVGMVVLNNNGFEYRHVTPIQTASLPFVHLSKLDGDRLRSAMVTARNLNGRLRARIDASSEQALPAAGVLPYWTSDGASRVYDGVLKPNLVAPSNGVFAASLGGAGYYQISSDLAASSVAAGLAAKLMAARPEWSLAQVESALHLTAADARLNGTSPVLQAAAGSDAGSGVANADLAMQAGLHFPITIDDFQAANPATGGDPAQLNLPSIYTRQCLDMCTFTRTVAANFAGSWSIQTEGSANLQLDVTPSQFSLQANESVTLTITARLLNRPNVGAILNGKVLFASTNNQTAATMDMPVVILPGAGDSVLAVDLGTQATLGQTEIQFPGLAGFDQVGTVSWPLKPLAQQTLQVNQGARLRFLVNRPQPGGNQTEGRLVVTLNSTTAPDLDLYVLRELTGDDLHGNGEVLCRSTTTASAETCELATDWTTEEPYVIEVNGYQTSAAGDQATLGIYNEVPATEPALMVLPSQGRTSSKQTLRARASWDLSKVPPLTPAISYVSFRDSVGIAKTVRLNISRADSTLPVKILSAAGESTDLVLLPGQAHEQMFVDVPANTEALIIRTEPAAGQSAGNTDLYVSRDSSATAPPEFPVAPARTSQPFRSTSNTNLETVALEGGTLVPGRYFITPVNVGTEASRIRVTVQATFAGNARQPAANGYFNPQRSGHGVFLAKTPQVWALAWYTFDSTGKPIWYTAQGAAATASAGAWSAPLYRSTWNGARDLPQAIGRVTLSFEGSDGFVYSWDLEGRAGSERFVPIGNPVCANGTSSVGGGWLRPDQSGWGSYFLNFAGNFEAEAIYVYDQDGMPRWVIGDGTFAPTLTKTLYQVRGFCPTCAFAATTQQAVGTASRTLITNSQGRFSSQFNLTDGLVGSWLQQDVAWSKLTPDLGCAP